jgi:acetoin utilization protein AcuB
MFYIKEMSGVVAPYSPGAIRRVRNVETVSPIGGIGSTASTGFAALLPETNPPINAPQPPSSGPLQAYERAVNRESPRQRVFKASEMMSTGVVTINDSTTLSDAASIFRSRRFRHIPVLDNSGALVGLLSDRDLLKRAAQSLAPDPLWEQELVRTVMSSPVLAASPETEIREIARVMFHERIGCLPLLGASQELVGIITRSDILRTLLVQAPLELWS